MRAAVKWLGGALVALGVLLAWAVLLVPPVLDRIYYEGPESGHFDGERFFNPDGEDTAAPPGGGGRAGFFWRQLTGRDARPPWPARMWVTPAKPPARVDGDRMLATWVGHATVLVQAGGVNILTDPIWSDTAGPFGVGPRRVAAPGVRFEDLPKIDLVVVSHNHYDHMDLATLKRLWARDKPVIVTSLGNDALLREAGIPGRHDRPYCGRCPGVQALDWGKVAWAFDDIDRTSAGPPLPRDRYLAEPPPPRDPRFFVTVERNHHWGSRWFTDRNRALWSAFSIRTPAGNIFFAGDTGLGDGRWPIEARLRSGPYRLAIVPIGAFRFQRGKQEGTASHVGPIEAAGVFDSLQAPWGLPIHWGTFRLSYEAWDTPPRMLAGVQRCLGRPADAFRAHAIGEMWEVPPLQPPPTPSMERVPGAYAECLRGPDVAGLP